MKRSFIVILFLLIAGNAFATAQFPDHLVYKGKDVPIFSNPLNSYFSKDNPKPRDLFVFSCTACWRGYIAYWKIDDGYLYLHKIVEGTCAANAKEIPIAKIFPGQSAPVKAVWFSGTLRIPDGKRLMYVHMGYGSVYERDILLTIEKGQLVKETIIDNTQKNEVPGDEKPLDMRRKR